MVTHNDISGKVTVGDITVRGDSSVAGFLSGDIINDADVKINDVNVTANQSGLPVAIALGVRVGAIGDGVGSTESLTVGNVTVRSEKQGATLNTASDIAGGIATDGSLKTGDVTIVSTDLVNLATGINVGNLTLLGTSPGIAGKFDVGTVNVQSDSVAIGINVVGPSTFTITKDVIATSTQDSSSLARFVTGINAWDEVDLTINTDAGDVQITGAASDGIGSSITMWDFNGLGQGNLTITGRNKHTNKGQAFVVIGADNVTWNTDADYVAGSGFLSPGAAVTHQVATGKTVVINGTVVNGAYTVGNAANNQYAGTLVTQNVLVGGNVVVNNGLFAMDGNGANAIVGTLTIGNNNAGAQAPASVALYGNTTPGSLALLTANPTLGTNAVTDPTTGEKVLSLSSITEYKWRNVPVLNGYYSSNRKRASLADGFLLPASIHRYNTGWEATRDHLISGGQRVKVSKGILGQAPCDPCEPVCDACEPVCEPCEPTCDDDVACNPCDPCGSKGLSVGRSVWVNYIGRSNSYQSSYNNIGIENGDWEIGTDGVQVGLDLFKTNKAQLGLLFGYEGSKATLRSDRLDADDVYFGAYTARVFRNGVDFRAVYNYGSQDYKLNRFDPGLGFDWHSHKSAFDGNTHEINLELGKRIFANRRWSYRPVIGFDLLINNWDAALEDGKLATAIAYDGVDYTQAFLRIGSDLKFVKGGFVFNSGLYYSYDLNDNELKTKVFARDGSKLGYDKAINSTLYGSKLGRSVLTFNVGGSLALSSRTSVFGGFTGDAALDRDGDGFQSNGYVGLQYQW
jgi:hypothetical protein